MKLVATYSHRGGGDAWKQSGDFDWLTDIFEAPDLEVESGSTTGIRAHVRRELTSGGWAWNPRISASSSLRVSALSDAAAFQVQTGNISRAAYDLVKIQYLFTCRRIDRAALAVPSSDASQRIGSNIANADRIWSELQLFDRVITVPILLVEFD